MKNNDQRSGVIWLAIGLAIAFYSRRYGLGALSAPGPGFLPFVSGAAIAGLSLIVLIQQRFSEKRENVGDPWKSKNWPAMAMVMGALVLYAILLRPLGFLVDTFLLMGFLLRIMEPMRWPKVIAWAGGITFGAYMIFETWLKAQLPAGILGF